MIVEEERRKEQEHFDETIALLTDNVKEYRRRIQNLKQESDDLYAAVTKGGQTELYNQLAASLSILEHAKNTLRKNETALNKPYFGRIDYEDLDQEIFCSLYIGKNGISKNQDVVIVDWRAPVSSIYYENEMGEGSYEVPLTESLLDIPIDLKRKRTYDTDHGELLGYYDNDVASNDELLVKYLAKNKDAVLGDIIATIQKEQNEIIRDTPYKNMIVQGVAGSGKTTVAMHRISYILYNYGEQIHPSEFCIIGSSDMLLSYITSGLPELDVSNVRYMRMDGIFRYLLDKQWKKSWKIISNEREEAYKSHLSFVRELDCFLEEIREVLLIPAGVTDPTLGVILSADNIRTTLEMNRSLSVTEMAALLNERLLTKIASLMNTEDKEAVQTRKKSYRKYFNPLNGQDTGPALYLRFLKQYETAHEEEGIRLADTCEHVSKNRFDVYDMAALVLIHKRLTSKKPMDEFSQIVVDEGQDFGEAVYYVLKRVLSGCYFTVMGDVSQNINYDTGMNDWTDLKYLLFDGEKDRFAMLQKSYRNTIEISEFAGNTLKEASEGTYRIEPVIRHGRPVEIIRATESHIYTRAAALIEEIKSRGHITIAVICRNSREADQVSAGLKPMLSKEESQTETAVTQEFHNGVMILPVSLTKGLEFDAVILWKPDEEHYGHNLKDAKLLYVAITRALHELFLLCGNPPSPLITLERTE